ncbi:hypothetical protein [Arthrobacter sp. B10-11]|uniref:hypothetical protein n=1 Tax=Arthrobacter sp. B10-11 TaxID=3081160 RepID=UPI0029536FAA|nr:hypothetical protein [Arthrobacter sp. B10-11]MDV8148769.1 hypothetical protein [Arthrobacter sp. B10-11]
MRNPTDLKNAARTWQTMVDNNHALLLRKSGHDAGWWAELARAAGLRLDAPPAGRLTAVKVRAGDFFDRKVRLTSVEEVDDDVLDFLAKALHQNS